MKSLLIKEFTVFHKKQEGDVPLDEQLVYGKVNVKDEKACGKCIQFFASHCEHEVFKLTTQAPITLINIENFINKFFNIKGQRCDYLLYDANKICLTDVSCSMEEYLYPHLLNGAMKQGKRIMAREQIEHTLELLCEEPAIKKHIEEKKIKIGMLAYRAKDENLFQNVPKIIEQTMKVWQLMENDIETRKLSFPMPYGFSFEMIRYPNVYKW